jgi:hypothetical protein
MAKKTETSSNSRAIAVMGKVLAPDGSVTCEYATRVAALFKELRDSNVGYQAAYFVGGKPKGGGPSEAQKGKETFDKQFGTKLKPPIRCEIEEESRNSIENVVNLAKLLNDQGYKQVDLLSSGYHIDRLEAVDQFMKNQSLLQELGRMRGNLIRAPYIFEHSDSQIAKVKARVYTLADSLNVPRVNVEGVLQGKEQCLFPGVTNFFAVALMKLHELARQSHEWSGKDLASLKSVLTSSLSVLDGCLSLMLSLQSQAVGTSAAVEAMRTLKELLDCSIDDLRRQSDQDRPVGGPDWQKIKDVVGI